MAVFEVGLRGLTGPYAPPPGRELLVLEAVEPAATGPILAALAAAPPGAAAAEFRCRGAVVRLRSGPDGVVVERPGGPQALAVDQAGQVLAGVAAATDSAPPATPLGPAPTPGWQSVAVLLLACALGTAVILSTLF